MGGSKFMGRDSGVPHTEESMAFECFFYWLLVGWLLCFGLSMLFISPPDFIIPFIVYLFGIVFLLDRYLKIEKGNKK